MRRWCLLGRCGLDLYFAVDLGPEATVEELTEALPSHHGEAQVVAFCHGGAGGGHRGRGRCLSAPLELGQPGSRRNHDIQVNWFTAACAPSGALG